MGNCCGARLTEDQRRNRAIEAEMRAAEVRYNARIKILLLGAGESGKSTLFKQMRLLYSDVKKFTTTEKNSFRIIIHGNIVHDIKNIIRSTITHSPIEGETASEISGEVLKWKKNQKISEEEAEMLDILWKDPGIQKTWGDRGDIQVQDALEYYMEGIMRIGSRHWEPTNQDILRARARTTGVVQENFEIDQTKFEMYDVGGQRNERRKWMHQFDGVTTVLFVAAISEYNQVLYEDTEVNRQDEAVQLFKDQLELDTFVSTPFILFLNKSDLFREKLTKIPFKVTEGKHPRNVDFKGPHCDVNRHYNWQQEGADQEFEACYQAAVTYLAKLYEGQSPAKRGEEPQIYTHPTNSTDSENIRKIMMSCKDIILKENLQIGGWL